MKLFLFYLTFCRIFSTDIDAYGIIILIKNKMEIPNVKKIRG